MAGKGIGVFMADLRGMGETARSDGDTQDTRGGIEARILGDEASGAYDGLKLGRSIFGMRVYDLLQIVEYLSNQTETAGPIAVVGRNSCGPVALYAAALDERVKAVAVDESLALFSDLVTTRDYTWHFMDFLPRVLANHDLPQVVGSLAPRPVWILNPLDAVKQLKDKEDVSVAYSWSANCYELYDQRRDLQIKFYRGPEENSAILQDWISSIRAGDTEPQK